MSQRDEFDVVVVGHGAAGLAAAVTAGTTSSAGARILVLERTDETNRGGNTRWTGAYLRLGDVYEVAPGLIEDADAFSRGSADLAYWRRVVEELPDTMEWLQEAGVRLAERSPTFIAKSRPRMSPVGGGDAIVRCLSEAARGSGITFRYERTATGLLSDDEGSVSGVSIRLRDGRTETVSARAVILATGGFEGNPRMMAEYFGHDAHRLRTLAPGGQSNKGEGIEMGLRAGAKGSGQWDLFHATLIDPRSNQPDAGNAGFPYGVLLNQRGLRFIDEASGTVDEIYEDVARTVRTQPGGVAYMIGDRKLEQVPGLDRAIRSDKKPVSADSLSELVGQLGLPIDAAVRTISHFNDAVRSDAPFDPLKLDGRSTVGLDPPKSNWAQKVDSPPFVAYPVECSIVFTFGGLATSLEGEVVTDDGTALPGLFAAGECTGIYYGKYLGATSVLRSLVFGRIAGRSAVRYLAEARH